MKILVILLLQLFISFMVQINLETTEDKIDLVSFSLTIVNRNMQNFSSNYPMARSNFILALMQVDTKKEACILFTSIKIITNQDSSLIKK